MVLSIVKFHALLGNRDFFVILGNVANFLCRVQKLGRFVPDFIFLAS